MEATFTIVARDFAERAGPPLGIGPNQLEGVGLTDADCGGDTFALTVALETTGAADAPTAGAVSEG